MVALSDAGADRALALPGDGLREGIVQRLRDVLGDGLVDSLREARRRHVGARPHRARWRAAGLALRDVIGCEYFCFLSAIDWMPSPYGRGEDDPDRAAARARRHRSVRATPAARHACRCSPGSPTSGSTSASPSRPTCPTTIPSIDSWIPVYAGANWHEREAHEMFGIDFAGHNDLRNMYLPMEFEGHPLRKDFPLLARIVKPWPGIVDVEPLPGGDDDEDDEHEAAT